MDLFDRWPGAKFADHARGNRELQAELTTIFGVRTVAEWLEFGEKVNTPIAPVNTPQTLADDPQFQARLGWIDKDVLGADQLPSPLKYADVDLPVPTKAPEVGEDNDEVLRGLLGYDEDHIAALRAAGALG
jgi:crotonobetainyl-CoA:carnitine CoA-transferase CaiB-like acyl-CoA transferase